MADDLLVEQSFRYTYRDSVDLVAQQLSSKLRRLVTEKPISGAATAASDLIGALKARRRGQKRRDNFQNSVEFKRRWLMFRDKIESGDYIDEEDVLRRANRFDSEIIRAHMMAVQREIDDIIIGLDENGVVGVGGMLGTVTEGETPSATSAFPSAQTLSHGGAGLTMSKLQAIREQFAWADYDLDMEEPAMVITPTQMTDLTSIVANAGTNINLADQAQTREGKVTRFMQMTFTESNRLPIVGTTRSCVAFMPSNIVLGVNQDVSGDIYNVPAVGNTPYAEVTGRFDATRKQDSGVIEVKCTE